MTLASLRSSKAKEQSSKKLAPNGMLFESYLEMDPFDVYQRDAKTGWMALGGVCATILFGIICISCSIYLAHYKHTIYEVVLPKSWRNAPFNVIPRVYTGMIAILPTTNTTVNEGLRFSLNLLVTLCTESTGFVHCVTLKSALARESRLHSNTSLRILTAARSNRWTNPNGTLCNAIMAVALIISYVSSALLFIPCTSDVVDSWQQNSWQYTCIFSLPVLLLGTSLLLQSIIAMAGICQIRVLTWSTSPLDMTAALLHNGQLTRNPGRCMHNVVHSTSYPGPRKPSDRQPSAWESHPSIKKIVILLWCLVFACAMWGAAIIINFAVVFPGQFGNKSWSPIPNLHTASVGIAFDVNPVSGYPPAAWAVVFIIFIFTQGGLTVGLHCSELIANILRDEMIWRKATLKAGTEPSKNALLIALGSWPNVALLISKPLLHWMFGLSLTVQGGTNPMGRTLIRLNVGMEYVQIFYLTICLFVFALVSTFIARRHPQGPQPAAYGHLQTLADLVDEWSPTMWWGHKGVGKPICHAGTSDWPLPPVQMNSWYA